MLRIPRFLAQLEISLLSRSLRERAIPRLNRPLSHHPPQRLLRICSWTCSIHKESSAVPRARDAEHLFPAKTPPGQPRQRCSPRPAELPMLPDPNLSPSHRSPRVFPPLPAVLF